MKRKQTDQYPIPQETKWNNAKRWLSIIRYGESGTVIQLQDDCEYRIPEILENKALLKAHLGPYYKKYLLSYLPIDSKNLHEVIREALISLCEQKRVGSKGLLADHTSQELIEELSIRGYEIGLFISHISSLLSSERRQELIDLELLVRRSKNLSVIVFSERDITHPDFAQLADKCSFLFDHIQIYPLYNTYESQQFLSYYESKWNFSLPEKTTNEILTACGGYLWLIHDVERTLRDNPTLRLAQAYTTPTLTRKLSCVWSKFTQKEQHILRSAFLGILTHEDTLSHEFAYLIQIHALIQHNMIYTLGIPLLSGVIEKDSRARAFTCSEDSITIGSENVSKHFSRQEYMFLRTILTAKHSVVPRDIMACALWGADWENKYSDWAIDRIAHRVRSKLKKFGGLDSMLKTIKKKGFMFG